MSRTVPTIADTTPALAPDASPFHRFGESAALGALAAIAASLPAASRASSGEISTPAAWVAAAAMIAVPFAVLVALGRAARRAFRGSADGRGRPVVLFVIAWVALALPLYVVLGTVLTATTHHRALGGMTFGVLAIGIAVAAALVAFRTVSFAIDLRERRSKRTVAVARVALPLFALALATPVVQAIVATGLGSSTLTPGARAAFVDGAMALATMALAIALDPPPSIRRPVTLAGPLALIPLALVGGALIGASPSLGRALAAHAPLAGPIAASLGLTARAPSDAER